MSLLLVNLVVAISGIVVSILPSFGYPSWFVYVGAFGWTLGIVGISIMKAEK